MSATGDPARREAGFTLIEALTVVALTALISALVFPSLDRGLGALSLRQSTATLAAELHAARAAAIRTGAPVAFQVAGDGRGYRWGARIEVPAPRTVRFASDAPILFYPDGSASGGVVSALGGGRDVRLSVDPADGAITRSGA